ncbi:MAG: phosphatase PAP2 family protein [Terriglobia bacterium]
MEFLGGVDSSLFRLINGLHSDPLDKVFLAVSYPAEGGVAWVALCVLLLLFGRGNARTLGVMAFLAMIVADMLIGNLVGQLVPRTRPYLALDGAHQLGPAWRSNSFPSTHAVLSFAGAYMIGQLGRRLLVGLFVWAALIGFSRIYLGMHYPGDVVGGALIGVASARIVLFVWPGNKEFRWARGRIEG